MRRSLGRLWQRIGRLAERANKTAPVQFGLRAALLPFRVQSIRQARQEQSAHSPTDLVLLSVVRDGEQWLPDFLEHHRALGVRHFAILDNGSSDNTVALLASEPDVTLLWADVPYHAYENTMKRYLVRRFGKGRWCLFVDADELFDWPLRQGRDIGELVAYLDEREFNAVVCQLLDMWNPAGLSGGASPPRPACRHYSLAEVGKAPYPYWGSNEGEDAAIQIHGGGIRKTLFGTNNGLTKVSLFKAERRFRPFWHWHHVRNGRIADVTCVLYHYPFVEGFAAKVAEAVQSRRYGYVTTDEYEAYERGLQAQRGTPIAIEGAQELSGTDELLESGFLVASASFRERFKPGGADQSSSSS